MAQLRLASERPQGTASVRVSTPSVSVNGWSAGGHTVVEVVTDDMPFLVDSVSMALAAAQHDIHLVIHPQFVVRRDLSGNLLEVLDEAAATDGHDVARESWMHIEIDRVSDEDLDEIRDQLDKVLTDVRDAVEDWQRMHAQVERDRRGPRRAPAAAVGRGDRAGHGPAALAGRQPLHLPRLPRVRPGGHATRGRPSSPSPAPASASSGPTRRPRASCPSRSPPGRGTRRCWCWPRPTRRPPCTGRSTSTTSG